MRTKWIATCIFILGSCLFIKGRAQEVKEVKVHEDYFQLLPNYSYFALSQTGGFQHQFSVITENGDYDLGLNEVQDFANKKATKFYRILAGAPGIPQKPFDYPAELSALADEIKKQDDVKAIKYLGRYALVRVQQWIPAEFSEFSKTNSGDKNNMVLGYRAEATYKLYENSDTIDSIITGSPWGAGKICAAFMQECEQAPLILNYRLPTELESTSLIAASQAFVTQPQGLDLDVPQKVYELEVRKFFKVIRSAVIDSQAGTFQNALSEVLQNHKKSGSIPDGMRQGISLNVHILSFVGKEFPFKRVDEEFKTLRFSVLKLLEEEEQSLELASKNTKILYKVTLSLKNKFLAVSVKGADESDFQEKFRAPILDLLKNMNIEDSDKIISPMPIMQLFTGNKQCVVETQKNQMHDYDLTRFYVNIGILQDPFGDLK